MRLLSSCAARSAASPRRVILIAMLVAAVSLALALQLRVSTDISSLMPAHSRVSGALLDSLRAFGSTDRLILVVESPEQESDAPSGQRRQLGDLADRLAGAMLQSGLFDDVQYRVTAEQQAFFETLYFGHPFHFLSQDDLALVQARLAPDNIEAQVAELARNLRYSPLGASAQRRLLLDPLGFRAALQEDPGHSRLGGFELDLSDGYFRSLDGRSLFLIATPMTPSQDTGFDALLLGELEQITSAMGAAAGLQTDFSIPLADGFTVRLLGPYVETLYGSQAAARELLPTIVLTCLGLLTLFVLVFRSLGLLLVLAVPLATGILATAGLTALFAGQLTMITVGFAAMLAGLGIDFGIHLVERIGQESATGGNLREWITRAFATTGRGVAAGALTSAAIFLLIAGSEFGALRQFGWIVGLGILLTLLAMLTLLPALLTIFPLRLRPPRSAAERSWARWVVSHYRSLGLLGIAVTVGLGLAASQLEIRSNIYELGPQNVGYESGKDRIFSESGGSTNVVMVVVARQDLQDLLQISERIGSVLENLQSKGAIESYESLSSLLPSSASQQALAETVRQWDLPQAMAVFEGALTDAGFREGSFRTFSDSVLAYAADDGPRIDLASLRGTPGEALVERFLAQQENGWKSVAYLYPPAGQWENRVPEAVVSVLESTGEGVVVTGIVPSFNEISDYVKQEFLGLTLAALLIVWLVALALLRRPLMALLATVPAVIGLLWTLGLMQLLGIDLNLITVLIAPLIIGLGIDYALHVLNRYRERPDRVDASVSAVARAILLTSATTIIGFGSLAIADLPSLRALGLTVSIGMVCCTLTSLLLLPVLLTALDRARGP